MVELDSIYNESCLDTMASIESESVDLILSSPPYDAGQEYEDWKSEEDYQEFILSVVGKFSRILKPTGRVVWNVANSITSRGKIHSPLLINFAALNNAGLRFRDHIIWNQLNSENDTAWGSWASASAPYFRHQTESILVFYRDEWKKGKGESDVPPKVFPEWTRDIWNMSTARKKGHPCPFPEELAMRAIKMFSFVGDVAYDPFLGSGTTAVIAEKFGRKWIGSELNPEYCALAQKRIDAFRMQTKMELK